MWCTERGLQTLIRLSSWIRFDVGPHRICGCLRDQWDCSVVGMYCVCVCSGVFILRDTTEHHVLCDHHQTKDFELRSSRNIHHPSSVCLCHLSVSRFGPPAVAFHSTRVIPAVFVLHN